MTTVDIKATIETIKARMPMTYAAIQAKAGAIGSDAFALVRQGIRGEPNRFYAFERGHVVGTPFNVPGIMADVARNMVEFGAGFVCIWPEPATRGDDAAH